MRCGLHNLTILNVTGVLLILSFWNIVTNLLQIEKDFTLENIKRTALINSRPVTVQQPSWLSSSSSSISSSSSSVKREQQKVKVAFLHTQNYEFTTSDILQHQLPILIKQQQQQQQQYMIEDLSYNKKTNLIIHNYNAIIIPIWNPFNRILHAMKHNNFANNTSPLYESIYNFYGKSVNTVLTLGLRKYKFTSNHRMERCQMNTKLWFGKEYLNYDYYPTVVLEKLLLQPRDTKSNILVVRVDDNDDGKLFLKDWNEIFPGFNFGDINNNNKDKLSSSSNEEEMISEEGLRNICEIICPEIQTYKQLIQQATNINQQDKSHTLQQLTQKCPKQMEDSNNCIDNLHVDSTDSNAVKSANDNKKKRNKRNKKFAPIYYDPSKSWIDYDTDILPTNQDIGNQTVIDISIEKRDIAFIHIGKTGGVTASTMIRKKCFFGACTKNNTIFKPENIPPNETQISLQVKEYFHARRPNHRKYNSFIITARHPIHRMISFYLHKHPSNGIAHNKDGNGLYKCFPTIDSLATYGMKKSDTSKASDFCKNNARGFLNSQQAHKFYAADVLEHTNKEILLLRTEFFWNDWQSINTMLGGGKISQVKSITHFECTIHTPKVTNRTVSRKGMNNLCYKMCNDIQIYKKLLHAAANLSPKEKESSLDMLQKTCPIVTTLDSCPARKK